MEDVKLVVVCLLCAGSKTLCSECCAPAEWCECNAVEVRIVFECRACREAEGC